MADRPGDQAGALAQAAAGDWHAYEPCYVCGAEQRTACYSMVPRVGPRPRKARPCSGRRWINR